MKYKRFDKTIVVRIDRGEEILDKIRELAIAENIKLASVTALGAMRTPLAPSARAMSSCRLVILLSFTP